MFHVFVSGGLALVAAGASALQDHNSDAASAIRSLRLLQAGMAILTVSWVLLVLCAAASALPLRKAEKNSVLFREGTIVSPIWSAFQTHDPLPRRSPRLTYPCIATVTIFRHLLSHIHRHSRSILPRGLLYPDSIPEPGYWLAHDTSPPQLSTGADCCIVLYSCRNSNLKARPRPT